MTEGQFTKWLEAFGKAWQTNEPDDIGALVPDTFLWHAGPYVEIFRDRATLVDHWVSTVNTHSNVKPEYQILACESGRGICRYWVSYLLHKTAQVECDFILLVSLDESGRCTEFHEWMGTRMSPLPEYV